MGLNLLPGVIVGSLVLSGTYILIALGITIAFRATRVLNFAEGQFLLLASYLFYWLSSELHLPFAVAVIGAVVFTAALGMTAYHVLLRPLSGQGPLALVLCTLGLSIFLMSIMAIIWGTHDIAVQVPLANEVIQLPADTAINTLQLTTMAVGLVVYLALLLFLRFSRVGIQMRATAEQTLLASQTGIDIHFVLRLAWLIIGSTAALAGLSIAFTNVITPTTGQAGLLGLAPAIVGGLDSIGGVLLGAVLVAFVQTLAITYLGGDSANAAAFFTLLVIMAMRPYGFFGTPGITRV